MNAPEYWRINLAVEKVIIRHEYDILEKQLSDLVRDNPFQAMYAVSLFVVFAASASKRLNNIIKGK